jgi:hypothetical protein
VDLGKIEQDAVEQRKERVAHDALESLVNVR